MKLISYRSKGMDRTGVLNAQGSRVHEIAPPADVVSAGQPWNMLALIRRMVDSRSDPIAEPDSVGLDEVELLAPIPRPLRNLWCVGRNYHSHAKELASSVFKANNADAASWPIVFTKPPECVVGPYDDVDLASEVTQSVDYEVELTVVIGRGGKNISARDAMSHVFGYTIINDVTARDVQLRHQQWDLGKAFDTFCPMGPAIVTADALDGNATRVRCWVNDELRQDASTRDMIFGISTLIETISRGITLYPGDVIATGTASGVGMGMDPPRYLRRGDVVRMEIDGLGMIRNRFV